MDSSSVSVTKGKQGRLSIDEVANTVTHGFGLLLSLVGLAVLLCRASISGVAMHLFSFAVYGVSLVCLYAVSTTYHAWKIGKRKQVLRKLDHCAIYLLIAGTYTPFALVVVGGAFGWSLFSIAWLLAGIGIFRKIFVHDRATLGSTFLFIGLGWMALIAVKPLFLGLGGVGFAFLVGGGFAYTAGTYFFHRDHRPFYHAIWHLFVVAGSVLHFIAVMRYDL